MTNYTITNKDSFSVLGIGTTLTGDYSTLPQKKAEFWNNVNQDGSFDQIKKNASNDLEFSVNEAINGEMHYYAGVQVSDGVSADENNMRLIQFPASEYLVVTGQADSENELFSSLEGQTFGQVLPELTDRAYVGGPNTVVITSKTDGVQGEMWVPVSPK